MPNLELRGGFQKREEAAGKALLHPDAARGDWGQERDLMLSKSFSAHVCTR